jgi:gluconolactonase
MRRLSLLTLLVPTLLVAQAPVLEPGATPKLLLKEGAGEGPAFHPELGILFSGGKGIGRYSRDGKASLYREKAGTNGLLFDDKGRLLACEPYKRRVTRTELDGTITVLTDGYDGKKYNQPNDLCTDAKGRIYFTDPCYGDRSRMEMTDAQGKKIEGVYRIDPDGKVTRVLGLEVNRPNGIRVSKDQKHLYVADNNNNQKGAPRKLWRFDLKDDGGVDVASKKLLFDWGNSRGPDGIKLDVLGRLYVAGGLNKANSVETNERKGGIYVLSAEGELLQFIHIDRDEVTNCAFGDDDLKTLYITAGGTLWSIRVTTPGDVPFPMAR